MLCFVYFTVQVNQVLALFGMAGGGGDTTLSEDIQKLQTIIHPHTRIVINLLLRGLGRRYMVRF